MSPHSYLHVHDEVNDALNDNRPVVAFESTIFSSLGLPAPANMQCYTRCLEAVRSLGVVPALTAVVDGQAVVGVDDGQLERVLGGTTKISARELPAAVGRSLDVGVTTVSASVTIAARAGIEVFATGGIGGVHRGAELSGDVSHDLTALARHRVVTVSSGAKSFLDLPRTLEYLETLGVPVLGWRTDRFPAFYVADSGLSVPQVDDASSVAAALRAAVALDHPGGLLLVNAIPADAALDKELIDAAVETGIQRCEDLGLSGPALTPVILAAMAEVTEGDSVTANLALAESNAHVAGQVAVALATTA